MEQHEVSDNAPDEVDERPLWVPPLPPEPELWSARMVFERFGFLLAMLGVMLVFGLIFLNADWLLRAPDSRRVAEAPSSKAATPTVSAVAESAMLTVFSDPPGARVIVDGSFIGETPLIGHSLEKGTRAVSVQKETFSTRDTVITVAAERSILQFILQFTLQERALGKEDTADAEDAVAAVETEPDPLESPPAQQTRTPAPAQTERIAEPPATPTSSIDGEEEKDNESAEVEAEPESSAPGTLQVTSQPSGATVFLSGQNVGVTPVLINEVEAGTQPITIQMKGFDPFETTVSIEPDERTTINGRLVETMASLRILAKPWGNIYIDGELSKQESTVWYTARLKPGSHRIRVEHPALGKWEQTVSVSATENDDIVVDFNSGGQ